MNQHPSLFDVDPAPVVSIAEGRRRRDEGIRLIDNVTRLEPWRTNAERAVRSRCELGEPFSSNEIREDVGDPPKPNMFGALFKWAEREGLVKWDGHVTHSTKPERHAGMTEALVARMSADPVRDYMDAVLPTFPTGDASIAETIVFDNPHDHYANQILVTVWTDGAVTVAERGRDGQTWGRPWIPREKETW